MNQIAATRQESEITYCGGTAEFPICFSWANYVQTKVNVENGTTFLIVTHNMDLAKRCDRIVEVVDGRMVAQAVRPHAP